MEKMKVAVVMKGSSIAEHFKQGESYNVFTITQDNIIAELNTYEKNKGCGCKSDSVSKLSDDGITVMIAGGMGEGAARSLKNHGIEVIRGCSGEAHAAVELFLKGMLTDKGSSCNHNHHHIDPQSIAIANHQQQHTCNCGGGGCNHN